MSRKRIMMSSVIFFLIWMCACANETSERQQPPREPSADLEVRGGEEDQPVKDSGQPADSAEAGRKPSFTSATVHDPSVIRTDDGMYYVFGSHLQAARSPDLMHWTQVASGVSNGNPLIPNVEEEMAEALEWGQTDTFWAGDVVRLADGKYYMYYSVCKGDSPRAAIGVAVSDHVEGPYQHLGIILKSGMWGQPSEDGTIYDPTVHPNTIDPHTFFDREGVLWMVYGSYSGGIYILKMDPKTGFPYPDQGYGKKLLGGNHSRIEGPYILYSPETEYYYLFLSFGGLDASGGYNIRVARSKNPDGPYEDAEGHDMIDAKGAAGTFFDDVAIEPYGVKLMGGFMFRRQAGEAGGGIGSGYVSPGHNSAYYDKESGEYYLIFHTRFPYRGESHEIRVHQMFMNAEKWPVVAPHRYAGETIGTYTAAEIAGSYKLVNHGKDISAGWKESIVVGLSADGKISGGSSGEWKLTGDNGAELLVDGIRYSGVFLRQWDELAGQEVMTFTALSDGGTAVWGSGITVRPE